MALFVVRPGVPRLGFFTDSSPKAQRTDLGRFDPTPSTSSTSRGQRRGTSSGLDTTADTYFFSGIMLSNRVIGEVRFDLGVYLQFAIRID